MKKIIVALIAISMMLMTTTVVLGTNPSDCTKIQSGEIYDSAGNLITTGYDQWGYNYQAHLFNGYYGNAARPTTLVTSGTWLLMKWNDAWLSNMDCDGDGELDRHYGFGSYIGSGAWCTNHQWGNYYSDWDITGDWVLEFDYHETLYIHDMTVVDNTFTGTGGYPAGGPYTTTWTVAGTITGDDISMRIDYDYPSSYYVDVVGTIAQDGTMSGTWGNNNQAGTWESSSGVATRELCYWDYFVKIVAVPSDAILVDGIWYLNGIEMGTTIWGQFAIIQQVYNDPCDGYSGNYYNAPAPTGLGYY